jgi:hypothetical protein
VEPRVRGQRARGGRAQTHSPRTLHCAVGRAVAYRSRLLRLLRRQR